MNNNINCSDFQISLLPRCRWNDTVLLDFDGSGIVTNGRITKCAFTKTQEWYDVEIGIKGISETGEYFAQSVRLHNINGAFVFPALKWDGEKFRSMFEFLGGGSNETLAQSGTNFRIDHSEVVGGLVIKKSDGSEQLAAKGDWIVKNGDDDYRVIKG